jgi:tetratricopeptide (TPR) repeat protein
MSNDDLHEVAEERRARSCDDEMARRQTFARRLSGHPSSVPPVRSTVPPAARSGPSSPPLPPPPPSPAPSGIAAIHLAAARAAAKQHALPEAARHYRAAMQAMEDPLVRAEHERSTIADQCILQGTAEEHQHHWAEAAALFVRAFEARHDPASAAHAASDFRRAKVHLDEAERLAEYAVSRAPNRVDFHLVLGLVYREEGRGPQARAEFERALQIDPENEHGLKFLALFDASEGEP